MNRTILTIWSLFLDTDCFLADNIYDFLEEDFDLGLTCIKHPTDKPISIDEFGRFKGSNASPINGGVIFSRATSGARNAWSKILETYDKLADMGDEFYDGWEHNRIQFMNKDGEIVEQGIGVKKWGGDQFSLLSLFGNCMGAASKESVVIDSIRVIFFDSRECNAAPELRENGLMFQSFSTPKTAHMKGVKRKSYTPAVAKHFGL